MSPDLINGLFEFGGAIALVIDVMYLVRDKQIKGVYWPGKLFFLSWGVWNLYFYGYYDHVWSWAGGIAICLVNAVWCYYAWKYTREPAARQRRINEICERNGFRVVE